jgi:hypothetical protein
MLAWRVALIMERHGETAVLIVDLLVLVHLHALVACQTRKQATSRVVAMIQHTFGTAAEFTP